MTKKEIKAKANELSKTLEKTLSDLEDLSCDLNDKYDEKEEKVKTAKDVERLRNSFLANACDDLEDAVGLLDDAIHTLQELGER